MTREVTDTAIKDAILADIKEVKGGEMVTDSALIEFFKLNADYFENNGIVGQVLKFLEWSLIRFFVMLADGAKTLFDAALA